MAVWRLILNHPENKMMNTWRALAVLWLACFCRGTTSCPALCTCFPQKAEVICSEVPLTDFPSEGLPENTTILTIQFTNITSISEQHLNSVPLLQQLHLYRNRLQSLPSHLLRGVPFLHTLDLTENKLTELPVDVFSHAPLRSLVLKNNLIENADAEWLPENSSLTWLDLSGNRLTKVPAALLQNVPHLEILDLSNNHLERISRSSLDSLTKLQKLDLDNNKLDTLDESTFQNTHSLIHLFLAQNKLNSLPKNLFQNLTQLRNLNLDDNQLSHIPPGSLDPLHSLDEQGIDLTSNPWLCNRKLQYLWSWLQKNTKKAYLPDSITCSSQLLAGRSVMSLTESELNTDS
ncbi:hypothetical protein Q5P01_004871 [Channa striata]|uniref:LRRCT domain-containing protein n=1 Tax=Channa striata TaxID=64152 RepID=A0AA88T2I5_CHASR|nr:hypothetical protein Q5P01_004871 [Channa striata]